MSTWDEVKSKAEKAGVITVSMEELREAAGAGKLGIHVRKQISDRLAGIGLGHVPQELPAYQHELVRVYQHGTPVGDLIDTVLNPGSQNDAKLAERFGSDAPDYATIVEKIRELVAE
ncbi:MAG: hypothetical protein QM756_16440 [Polyangiaceae bacterium]